jgi:carbon-monoxide dehydrogenase large subunit
LRYVVVDDVGTVINKMTLEGQIHGGVAHGIGQAFTEHLVYDPGSGQLLTGSLVDYGLPRAGEVCSFEMDENPVPTKTNPLGVKGAGEAGNVGALAAIMNAVIDALSPLGITHIDMPATREKVWHAIRAAQGRAAVQSGVCLERAIIYRATFHHIAGDRPARGRTIRLRVRF